MSVLTRLARCAAVVKVDGEDVSLSFPTDEDRQAVQTALRNVGGPKGEEVEEADTQSDEEKNTEAAIRWNAMCADALFVTAIDSEFTKDDASRIVVASMNEPESSQAKELTTLVDTALKLCGIDMGRVAKNAENVIDNAEEAADSIGDLPS